MLRIPLQPVPNQTLAVTLALQPAQIAVRHNGDSLFFDLSLNGTSIVRGKICRDRQRLLTGMRYLGFVGDVAFVDTQGRADPQFEELGTRWQLYYIGANE